MKLIKEPVFTPLSITEIQPSGWLKNQLKLQAKSLSGKVDEFWPDIKNSKWFGGDAEGWERAPYWLDGVLPLAYLLRDKKLINKVNKYMSYIISNQKDDGWLGPYYKNYDLWGQFLVLKVLTQYYDVTKNEKIVDVVKKACKNINVHINKNTVNNWAHSRWFEALIPIYWLYQKTKEDWLLRLAIKLYAQGFNWGNYFKNWPITKATPKGGWNYMGHVVNNAMAVKSHALIYQMTGDNIDKQTVYEMIDKLDKYHGMVTGVFSGDECLAGLNPVQGTELCAVVEYMYSLEILLSILGDTVFGDRLELIAFNALPATFSPDMWAHQYDQQVNQIECVINPNPVWTTNGPDANIFGLEPHFGCCTANLSQGWPKFTAHLWMKSKDNGLAVCAYAPSKVITNINGSKIEASIETSYPFSDTITIKLKTDKTVRFPLSLRIPSWARKALIKVNNKTLGDTVKPGHFFRINKKWSGLTIITLKYPMQPEVLKRPNNTVAIKRGPIIYSLKIGEKWKRINENTPYRELPHADWEIRPTTPWNYALMKKNVSNLKFIDYKINDFVFKSAKVPVTVKVKGQKINNSKQVEDLELIPYGWTNLRITEFPVK
ncbi:MAG: beta-L-arabinofuranosidase domain-containing protein [Elusimicrobiota bacterium]